MLDNSVENPEYHCRDIAPKRNSGSLRRAVFISGPAGASAQSPNLGGTASDAGQNLSTERG